MRVKNYSDPDNYGNIELAQKTYASRTNAEAAVTAMIAKWYHDATCHVIVSQNAAGRFVPVCVFQGKDATQACIDTARAGFQSFA